MHCSSKRCLPRIVLKLAFFCVVYCHVFAAEEPPVPIRTFQIDQPGTRQPGQRNPVVRKLMAERQLLDQTVWLDETDAQRHEMTFVSLWDRLRSPANKFDVLKLFTFLGNIKLGKVKSEEQLDWSIVSTSYGAGGESLKRAQWRTLVEKWKERGYKIAYTEWHHTKFEPEEEAKTARSIVSAVLYVTNRDGDHRYVISGDLTIQWSGESDRRGLPIPGNIDASGFTIIERKGIPAFEEKAVWETGYVPPILVYDLNKDGLSDIVFPGTNELFVNQGNWRFKKESLCTYTRSGQITSAIIADFTGDGIADYICATRNGFPRLYPGDEFGKFTRPAKLITAVGKPLTNPQVLTAGDIDGDGDLDLWIAQYKLTYEGGHVPQPYYDANDGYPSYLLVNQGDGRFEDATEDAGLVKKRFRRSLTGSLVDLDDDGDLDLMVVSDFAGVDLYHNDGKGKFVDVTDTVVDDASAFGMGHTFGDYNLDGELDFYVIGMSSTTARRLDSLGLGRKEFSKISQMRKPMTFGNRMYMGDADSKRFTVPEFGSGIARTGWSWGTTTFDFDNDADSDIFVGNGFMSGRSSQDYCTRFWCHDLYTTKDEGSHDVALLFGHLNKFVGPRISWNGHEKNVLFMNLNGKGFKNVGFLMGVGDEFDARSVISDDLDADGRADLLVMEHKISGTRKIPLLHFYRNVWSNPKADNWIGVRLYEEGKGVSPIGAHVTVEDSEGKKQIARFVTGDSFTAQHANMKHFGLGKSKGVKRIIVQWLNGARRTIANPKINRYHVISASGAEHSVIIAPVVEGSGDNPDGRQDTTTGDDTKAAKATGPRFTVETSVHEFGRIMAGNLVRHTFSFKNTGDRPLELTAVKTTCGCTVPKGWDRTVEPGKTGVIPVILKTNRLRGSVNKTIRVTTNDPNQGLTILALKGNVWQPLEFSPRSPNLGEMTIQDASKSILVKVTNHRGKPFEVTQVKSTNKAFKGEFIVEKGTGENLGGTLKITVTPPLRAGNNTATLSLMTSIPGRHKITIVARCKYLPPVHVEPAQIFLRSAPLSRTTTRVVNVSFHAEKPVKIISAEIVAGEHKASVEVLESSTPEKNVLRVTFPKGFDAPRPGAARLIIRTDYLAQPVVEVPIVKYISSGKRRNRKR